MTTSTSTPAARPRSKSRTSRATERAAADRAKLTVVPDPPADPEPAQAAPPPKLDPLAKLGKALGQPAAQARPVVVPDLPASVTQRAAAAAKTTPEGSGTAAAQRLSAAIVAGQKASLPKPKTQTAPKPARTPKVKAPKVTGPADAKATYKTVERFNGLVTVTAPGQDPKVHQCEHAARNGHITIGAATACAARLTRNYKAPDGGQVTVGTETRGRYWGVYQADAPGSAAVECGCRFGHKHTESAVACAKTRAAAAGLTAV